MKNNRLKGLAAGLAMAAVAGVGVGLVVTELGDEPAEAPPSSLATTIPAEPEVTSPPAPTVEPSVPDPDTSADEPGQPVVFPGTENDPWHDEFVVHDPAEVTWPTSRDEAGRPRGRDGMKRMEGTIKLSDEGQTLSDVEIFGHVVVEADNVTLTNCVVHYDGAGGAAVDNQADNFVLEQCDLLGPDQGLAGFRNGQDAGTARVEANYIEGFSDHLGAEGGTVDFIRNLSGAVRQTETTHNDAIQILGGVDHRIIDNHFRNVPADGSEAKGQVVWLSGEYGIDGVTVEGNLIEGGAMAFGVGDGASDVKMLGNVWKADTIRYAPVHPRSNVDAVSRWEDNRLW